MSTDYPHTAPAVAARVEPHPTDPHRGTLTVEYAGPPPTPAGQFCSLPRGTRLYSYVVTGMTVLGENAAVCGTIPAPDQDVAEREVSRLLAHARTQPATGDRKWPDTGLRTVVFELRLDQMAEVLKAHKYRVQEPPARTGEGGG